MTRWPRRLQPLPAGFPVSLQRFDPADWQEWLLDGPDPAAQGLTAPLQEWMGPPHPVTRMAFRGTGHPPIEQTTMVGIGDRPELVAVYRRHHAQVRWRAARRAWLERHGHHDLAFDWWIDDVAAEHRQLTRELAEVAGRTPDSAAAPGGSPPRGSPWPRPESARSAGPARPAR